MCLLACALGLSAAPSIARAKAALRKLKAGQKKAADAVQLLGLTR